MYEPSAKYARKVPESPPSDSGIESGTEKLDKFSETSVCSSPRSCADVSEETSTAFPNEDMPVLKRVLQAPPLYDTNSLMEAAYKPHKKFRRPIPGEESTTSSAPTATSVSAASTVAAPSVFKASLSATHSMLARSLAESPKLTPEQLKQAEVIQNYIMQEPSSWPPSAAQTSVIMSGKAAAGAEAPLNLSIKM
jgi:nuclear receptor subfamily 1 group D member 3